ncbi:hypothetical protein ACOMHN_044641 [Nucella lapillus]
MPLPGVSSLWTQTTACYHCKGSAPCGHKQQCPDATARDQLPVDTNSIMMPLQGSAPCGHKQQCPEDQGSAPCLICDWIRIFFF